MPILEATASDSLLSEQRVLECVSDDPNAFFLLWPSYQHDLYHACLSWMGNQQDAEDALSEIALKAWKRLPKYADKITNLKGWLTRLSYNHCMDIQLQRQKQDPHQVDLQTMIEAGTVRESTHTAVQPRSSVTVTEYSPPQRSMLFSPVPPLLHKKFTAPAFPVYTTEALPSQTVVPLTWKPL